MSKYLKLFETTSQYNEYINGSDVVLPNVSVAKDAPKTVYFNPWVEPFFVKLSLKNGEVVELQGSGELTSAMVSSYKSSVVSAEIGELCTSIVQEAFFGCSGLTSVTIGNSVTSIGNGAFNKCTSLTSITIGSGVRSIGRTAFSSCTNLTSITIPDSVTVIGDMAFSGCTGLTSITIPDSVTRIGESAFYECSGLTSVNIGSGVRSIGQTAFGSCTGLTSVTIGSGVTSIGNSVFYNCSSLTSITSLAAKAPTITKSTFNNVKTGGTLYVPSDNTDYDVWMGTGNYYLGKYNWRKVEQ